MDSSTIDRIGQLAIEANGSNCLEHVNAIVLHDDQKVHSLEKFSPGRTRYRGAFATTSLPAFVQHVEHTRETLLGDAPQLQGFVDTEAMTATVYFNLGDATKPGHGDHRATLNLKPTAAYAALRIAAGRAHDQRSLHDFLEDWRENIVPIYGTTPDESKMASALAAIRDITIETARTVQSEVRDMGGTASAMERVDAASRLTLPSGFDFRCTPYEGLTARTFRLRLGVNTGNDKISLVLRIQQAEQAAEAIANEVQALLADKLGTTSSLTLGTFTP